ncbi:hypothetical protein OL229_15650 [Neisseriaceae bacterium JH1-16]|nr:hypothetical protein [Neisseriaceae bacterium JH1-16]
MKRYAPLFLVTLLAACSSGGGDAPASSVSGTPSNGAQAGVLSGDPAGNYGEAYVSNGQGYLLVSTSDNEPTAALYKLGPGNSVQRVPPTANGAAVSASFASGANPDTSPAPTLAALAGSYSAVAGQQPLDFSIAANGALSGGGSCTISGQLNGNVSYGSALSASFTLQGCGAGVDGSYTGLALQPANADPARLRLVGASGSQVLDLLAY